MRYDPPLTLWILTVKAVIIPFCAWQNGHLIEIFMVRIILPFHPAGRSYTPGIEPSEDFTLEHLRTYSRITREALALLGREIRIARMNRKITQAGLASRIGIARSTLQLIEKGQPTVEIGLAFEAAALLGVPLFVDEPSRLAPEIARLDDKLALLPQSIRRPRSEPRDDF